MGGRDTAFPLGFFCFFGDSASKYSSCSQELPVGYKPIPPREFGAPDGTSCKYLDMLGPMVIKILKWLLALGLAFVLLSLAAIWYIGAWNIVFPSSQHDEVAPALPTDLGDNAILVFSKTNSFRHKDGIPGGNAVLKSLAEKNDWGHFATENGAAFNDASLQKFSVVIFNSASGDMLSDAQEAAFQDWLQAGGGWIGIHAAGDSSHKGWTWYVDNLIGADFTAHIMGPQTQAATINAELADHPVMAGLPPSWEQEEEWYSWEESPRVRGFTPLATVDETSYDPFQRIFGSDRDLRMGDHPVVWINCIGQGRSLYSAMGHWASAFDIPEYQQLLENAVVWARGEGPSGCPEKE